MKVKEKWKGFGKKTVSILLCASLVLPFGQGVAPDVRAAAGAKSPVCFQASRLPADSLPEGNCIYFGTAAATVKERGEYEVRVYREGDFDSAASVEVRTLDMSAVYGEDYELVMEDVEQSGDGKTLLEKYVKGQASADDGNKLPDAAASESTAGRSEGKSASKVSSLAAKKEAQTGVESRELREIEEKSFVESMSDVLVGDTMENIDASSKCTITFDAGEKSKTVRFRIREDEKSEGTEGFSLLLANAEGAEIFQVTTCAISIEDDEKAEHSKISFSQPEYRAADGKAVLTVKRTGAEYSICDMTVRTCGDTAQAGTNYEEKNETLAFAPYETEKKIEMDVAGSGRFRVMLDDLKACEEGEIVKAAVEIAENGGKTLFEAADRKNADGSDSLSFTIQINSKPYRVEYKMGDAFGKIMDDSYAPALEVGTYYFSSDQKHGGLFSYGHVGGDKPNALGTRVSEYHFGNSSEMDTSNYGDLKYLHTTTSAKGFACAESKAEIPGVYYQYFVPDWESTKSYGGGQRARLTMFDGQKEIGKKSYDGQFKRSQDNAVVKNLSGAARGNDGMLSAKAEACDEDDGKTPRSYVKFYGLCAMNRKFNVSLEAANALSYRTGTKDSSVSAEPVQVSVECGAQVWNGDMGSEPVQSRIQRG